MSCACVIGYILPTTGRIRVFHPLECALTGRTDIEYYQEMPWIVFFDYEGLWSGYEKATQKAGKLCLMTGLPSFFEKFSVFRFTNAR